MLQTRLTSSLEKCFSDDRPERFPVWNRCSALRGSTVSFQLIFRQTELAGSSRFYVKPVLSGDLAPYAALRSVEEIPSKMPVYFHRVDPTMLRVAPGLYPDLLKPLRADGCISAFRGQCRSLWIDVTLPKDELAKGLHRLNIALTAGEETLATETVTVKLADKALPASDFPVTEWFHCDCLASYYHVPVFSERHWEIIENFLRTAVRNGITMILTPLFTPPLDTAVGKERPTVQLVDVEKNGGSYRFGYARLDRWVALCKACGVRYFEMSHLFTQWGAEHAPKIVATVNGKEEQIFNWSTDATGADYSAFLAAFLPDLTAHLRALGIADRCVFHISDEPNPDFLDKYRAAKETCANLLKGFPTMDALSHYCFYTDGLVQTPVVANDSTEMDLFLKNVPNYWVYYCCNIHGGYSNRSFCMSGSRTRAMGYQIYANRANGFLQWGYNFYYNQGSTDLVNPYLDSTGDGFTPSGDCYSVYPAEDGTALESMRIVQFREGLEDRQLLSLCEKAYGRARMERLLRDTVGKTGYGETCEDASKLLTLREKLVSLYQKIPDGQI